MRKIILTGGGTAGHISPIVALIEILKKNSRINYLYVGSRSGQEKEIAKEKEIKFYGIFVGKRRNYISFSNILDLFKTLIGLIQSYFLLKNFKPDVIFAKGGYVTFPILFWAKRFNIPVVIHESDLKMGRANLWASHFARKICLGFPLNYYEEKLPMQKMVYTGIPISRDFIINSDVKNERPHLLVTGGSQGSQKINEIILEIARELINKYEVFHLCGQKNYEELKSKISDEHKNDKFSAENYHLIDFSSEMPRLMSEADLIISRAGASTLAEISALGKAAILIPLPSAHLDHQTKNAQIYADKNAAVLLSEKGLTASSLLSIINNLMEDSNLRNLIAHHAKEFAVENSAQEIIDILFEVSNNSEAK